MWKPFSVPEPNVLELETPIFWPSLGGNFSLLPARFVVFPLAILLNSLD
jgi:hypothetical protein